MHFFITVIFYTNLLLDPLQSTPWSSAPVDWIARTIWKIWRLLDILERSAFSCQINISSDFITNHMLHMIFLIDPFPLSWWWYTVIVIPWTSSSYSAAPRRATEWAAERGRRQPLLLSWDVESLREATSWVDVCWVIVYDCIHVYDFMYVYIYIYRYT